MTPWTVACQASLSMGFPRQEYWSGFPFPSPGDLPDPGIKPVSHALVGGFFVSELPGKPLKGMGWNLLKSQWVQIQSAKLLHIKMNIQVPSWGHLSHFSNLFDSKLLWLPVRQSKMHFNSRKGWWMNDGGLWSSISFLFLFPFLEGKGKEDSYFLQSSFNENLI